MLLKAFSAWHVTVCFPLAESMEYSFAAPVFTFITELIPVFICRLFLPGVIAGLPFLALRPRI
jgi:hypothetical protein